MGYRSIGCMIITGPHDLVRAEVLKLRMSIPANEGAKRIWDLEQTPELRFCPTAQGKEFTIAFRYEGWKMYDGYEDVSEIERIWHHFAALYDEAGQGEPATEICGVYIRLGEDSKDIEERQIGEGYELASVSVSFSIDCDVGENDFRDNRLSSTDQKTREHA